MIEKKLITAGLAFGLAASWMVPAHADLSAFKKQFTSKNSWEQAAAIRLLDAKDKKEYDVLTDLLKALDWYLRDAVIEVLSTAMSDAEASKWMEKDIKKGKTYVAEGIALAIGRSADSSKVPWLVEALSHKDWQIRRSAAVALKEVPDKRAVEPLLEAWKDELKKGKQFRVWTRCVEALEDITGEKFDTLGDWENWWKYNKDSFAIGGKKKDDEGSKSGTVLRGVELNYDTAGDGGPLLVIPDYGFEKSYMKTYLRNLEEFNQCIYMDLPGAANFDPPLPPEPGLPYPKYPLEKISSAFEELIKKMSEEGKLKKKGKDVKVNVFCHGMSGWIGMAYAAKFPGSVRRLVLCNPFSSGKAWGDGNDRLVKKGSSTGDLELEHFANSRIVESGGKSRYEPTSSEEQDALTRKGFTDYFADIRDSEIGVILGPKVRKTVGTMASDNYKVYRLMGGVMIPSDFKVQALPSVPVPTLIIVGKFANMTSLDDCNAIAKHYPSSSVVVFDRSSMMPFIEENTKFTKTLNKFLN